MRCKKCFKKYDDSLDYCPRCGARNQEEVSTGVITDNYNEERSYNSTNTHNI